MEVDPDAELMIARVAEVTDLPPRLAVILGDATPTSRSALVQLVSEIAFIDSVGKEFDKTAFPASMDIANFRSSYVQGNLLEGVNKSHRALIARYQPYHRWKVPGYSGPIR